MERSLIYTRIISRDFCGAGARRIDRIISATYAEIILAFAEIDWHNLRNIRGD
jgi:hypothetical protein